jgi:8-oxo-dGTP pyrophosphatase MutT (NUDIX family)
MSMSTIKNSTAQAVRLFLHRPDGTILVVTRAHRPGVLCMPGGKVDLIDAGSPEVALRREVKEETGLDLNGVDLSVLFQATAHDDKGDIHREFEVITYCAPWDERMGVPREVESGVVPSWVFPEVLRERSMGGDYEEGVLAAWAERTAPDTGAGRARFAAS